MADDWAVWDAALEDVRDAVGSSDPTDETVRSFRRVVWDHYGACGRAMPWRETRDPWRILVSEVMLQQTQVDRVLPKYQAFFERFPDAGALAQAELADVFRVWRGLGYNRRAVWLREAAKAVVHDHAGLVPRDREALVSLKGIGPATSAGVLVFAYGEPVVYLETNVRAAMLHCFFPERDEVRDAEVAEVVEATLDRADPRHWYYALMDVGSAIKRVHDNPSRKSAHHRAQGPFEGSDRQVRGRVLGSLVEATTLELPALVEETGTESARLETVLGDLERDGLIVLEGGSYRIA